MKILMATSGSGGHVIPALATAEILRQRGHDVRFAGNIQGDLAKRLRQSYTVDHIESEGVIQHKGWKRGLSALKLVAKTLPVYLKYRSWSPDRVVGFGGYGSVPVVLAGRLLGSKVILHEQNVIPGKATRFLSRWSHRIAISFPETRQFFPWGCHTGCPTMIRVDNQALRTDDLFRGHGLYPGRTTIVLLGGSQGSKTLNQIFLRTVPRLLETCQIQVIHCCGSKDYQMCLSAYQKLGIPFALYTFSDKMREIYAMASVVVSRSGAVTVTELGILRCPAVLIPYPYAQGHQKENARVLTEAGLATLIEEGELSEDLLFSHILNSLRVNKKTDDPAVTVDSICPQADHRLADLVLSESS